MKVRIIKAGRRSYWYSDKIGEVFEIEETSINNSGFRVSKTLKFIDKEDCELIEDFQYGEEVEVRDYNEEDEWKTRTFLCVAPNGEYVVWNNESRVASNWEQCRKVNTELEQLEKAYEELGQKINQLEQLEKAYEELGQKINQLEQLEKAYEELGQKINQLKQK